MAAVDGSSSPMVSVGLPVYNGGDYVAEAIESILNQTFQDFKLLIQDNASTAGTEEICRSYARKDPRVSYVRNPENVGAAPNYILAFERARDRWIGKRKSDGWLALRVRKVIAGYIYVVHRAPIGLDQKLICYGAIAWRLVAPQTWIKQLAPGRYTET